MVNSRATRATDVQYVETEAGIVVKLGGETVGIIEQSGDAIEYTAASDLTMDGHFANVDDAKAFIEVALGAERIGHGEAPTEVPDIIAEAQKPKRQRKTNPAPKPGGKAAPKGKTDAALAREQAAKERAEARERAKKERQAEKDRIAAERDAEKRRAESLEGLLPTKLPTKQRAASVELALIDGMNGGDPATAELVASVRQHGFLQLPRVRREGDRYVVQEGRRRLQAAQALGWTAVDVIVDARADTEVNDAVVALVTNMQRGENAIGQHRAVMALLAQGWTEKKIAAAVGRSTWEINRLRDLGKLHPALMQAVEEGKMAASSARRASQFDHAYQEKLVDILATHDKVTVDDIKQVNRDVQNAKIGSVAGQIAAASAAVAEAGSELPELPMPELRGRPQRRAYTTLLLQQIARTLGSQSDKDDDESDLESIVHEFLDRMRPTVEAAA